MTARSDEETKSADYSVDIIFSGYINAIVGSSRSSTLPPAFKQSRKQGTFCWFPPLNSDMGRLILLTLIESCLTYDEATFLFETASKS